MDMRGWVRRYVEHGVNTETPASFRALTALTIVAAMLKRKIKIEKRLFQVWPPFQCMLIGPAGGPHKSTSALYGLSLINRHLDEVLRPIKIQSAGSPEALLSELADLNLETATDKKNPVDGTACGLQVVSELSAYLTKAKYSDHMINTLCEVYDSPTDGLVRVTKGGGREYVYNVGVSAILCSNEEYLASSIPLTATRGGFPSRVIFMYEDTATHRVANPEEVMPSVAEEHTLTQELVDLVSKRGDVGWTKAARDWSTKWYDERERVAEDPDVQPLVNREYTHQLRIAMLLAASGSAETAVTMHIEHMQQAQGILDYAKKSIPKLYRIMSTGTFGLHYERVKRIIANEGGEISHAKLGRKLSHVLSATQVKEITQTMLSNDEIEISRNIGQRDQIVKLKGSSWKA